MSSAFSAQSEGQGITPAPNLTKEKDLECDARCITGTEIECEAGCVFRVTFLTRDGGPSCSDPGLLIATEPELLDRTRPTNVTASFVDPKGDTLSAVAFEADLAPATDSVLDASRSGFQETYRIVPVTGSVLPWIVSPPAGAVGLEVSFSTPLRYDVASTRERFRATGLSRCRQDAQIVQWVDVAIAR